MWDNSDGFFHWLAGFIDGEGSFNIAALGKNDRPQLHYVCRFELHLRSDDYKILVEIKDRTGMGRLIPIKERQNRNWKDKPLLAWRLDTKEGCAKFVTLLNTYPLRAKKSIDFEIWRRAVAIWNTVQHGVPTDWTEMAALKAALHELRLYRNEHEDVVGSLIQTQRRSRGGFLSSADCGI